MAKRTREELEAELAALDAEEDGDDDTEIIVIRGKAGIAKLLKSFGYEDEDGEGEEEGEEEEEEVEEEGEEEPPKKIAKKSQKVLKKAAKKQVVEDAPPKGRSRWFD